MRGRSEDLLIQDTKADGNGGLDADWNVYPARLGEVIDVVLQNDASEASGLVEAHPWHFHGRKVRLIAG